VTSALEVFLKTRCAI